MAYIGKSPVIGNFVKLDAITAVNGQAAYTMQNGGSNFTDYESVNQFLVSLNGTIQAPTDSFTVSGSTLTFASNLATGDVIDFIMVFGNSLSAGTPTDGTVTAAKLNDDVISGQTALASEPADTDEFLVSDAGILKRIDYSLIKGGGITMADNWRLNADDTVDSSETDLDTGWERVDTTGQGTIGSAMTQSSGVFTFPSTGIYLVQFQIYYVMGTGADYGRCLVRHRTSGGTMTDLVDIFGYAPSSKFVSLYGSTLMDIQDTANDLVIFYGGGNVANTIAGNTAINRTSASFIRLGDT